MHFFYDVSIPKSTAQSAPHEEILPLTYGEIVNANIIIPTGHKGKAHLVLLYHEFQIFPLSRGEDYHGDGCPIDLGGGIALDSEPYQLKARGWNTDTVSDHAFLIGIDVEIPDSLVISASAKTLSDLRALIGSEV